MKGVIQTFVIVAVFCGINAAQYSRCPSGIADPEHPVHLEIAGNCHQFIHCDNFGVEHIKDCAYGQPLLVFDEEFDMCVWPWETTRKECYHPGPVDPPHTTAKPPHPGCPTGIADPNNPVHLEIPGNCNQFVHCDNFGVGHIKNCAASNPALVFDKHADRCVWPWETDRKECYCPEPTHPTPPTHPTEPTTKPTQQPPYPGCPTGIADPNNPVHLEIPGNCNQFVHCDNFGVGHIKNCAASNPALVFDKHADRCVWPWETDRKECYCPEPTHPTPPTHPTEPTTKPTQQPPYPGCPTGIADPNNPVHLEIPGNCNQFVHCDNFGVGHIKNCAASNPALVFDKHADRCVWPWETDRKECYCPEPTHPTPPTHPTEPTTKPTQQPPYPGCPTGIADPNNPVHLEIPGNCNQFVHCDNFGVGHIKNCAASNPALVFDKHADRCVWPWETDRKECYCPEPTHPTPPTHPTEPTTKPTQQPPYPGCPTGIADPNNPVHLEIPGNCNQFVHCDNFGVGHIKNCAASNPALVFDKHADRCVWPWETDRKECYCPEPTHPTPPTHPTEPTTKPTQQPPYPGCPTGIADPNNPVHLEIPGNCNQFVHCDNFGVGHIKNCAASNPALVFDKHADRCVWPWETDRKECYCPEPTHPTPPTHPTEPTTKPTQQPPYPGCPTGIADPNNPVHLEIPGNCNQFVHCDNFGVGHIKNCAASNPALVFDKHADRCVWPWETDRKECYCPEPTHPTPPTHPTEPTTKPTQQPPYPGCPTGIADPNNPVHLEIPGNCNQFVHCDNFGVGHIKNCAASNPALVFDKHADRCVWPWETDRKECYCPEPTHPTPPTHPTEPTTKPTQQPPYPGCPTGIADPNNPVHLEIPGNCNQFVHCDNFGVGHIKNCAASNPALVFDKHADRCVWPWETDRKECYCPEPTHPTPPTHPTEPTTKPSQQPPYPGCPTGIADPNNPVHLEIPGNCNQFVHCDNFGVGHIKNCAASNPALVFDKHADRCVWPWETDRKECYCPEPTHPTPPTHPTEPTTKPTQQPPYPGCPTGIADPNNPVHLEIPGNCNQFVHCDNFGVGHIKNCAASNPALVFDKHANRCVWPWETDRKECYCPEPTHPTPPTHPTEPTTKPTQQPPYPGCPTGIADPNNPVHLEIPGNCNQFVHCDNFGVGHIKNCAPSYPPLVFDKQANRCVWPWETNRKECYCPEPTHPTPPTPPTEPTTKPTPNSCSGCPTGIADPNNPIHLEIPSNCNQFCHCDNFGVGHIKNCAPSYPPLVFDKQANRCVWPWETNRKECYCPEPTHPTPPTPPTEPTTKPTPNSCSGCPTGIADPNNPIHLEIPSNCNQFCHCDNFGVGHIKNCAPSYPPLVFDKQANRCVWPWETNRKECYCPEPTPPTPPTHPTEPTTKPTPNSCSGCPAGIADPNHPIHLEIPSNCNQFCHCDNFGVGHIKNCAPSDPALVFDESFDRCVWPWETKRVSCQLKMFLNLF